MQYETLVKVMTLTIFFGLIMLAAHCGRINLRVIMRGAMTKSCFQSTHWWWCICVQVNIPCLCHIATRHVYSKHIGNKEYKNNGCAISGQEWELLCPNLDPRWPHYGGSPLNVFWFVRNSLFDMQHETLVRVMTLTIFFALTVLATCCGRITLRVIMRGAAWCVFKVHTGGKGHDPYYIMFKQL